MIRSLASRARARLAVLVASGVLASPLAPAARGAEPVPPAAPAAAPFPGQWAPPPAAWRFPVWPKGCALRSRPEDRLACLEFVAEDWGRLSRYAEANAALPPPRAGERRVVFFGDSITDNWSQPANGGFFPGKPYVNRGISGQTTAQMLVRFRADVLAAKPRVVVILAGTNDVAGNAGPTTPAAIQDNLASLAELAQANGVRVVLASLLPVSDDKVGRDGAPQIRTKNRPPETIRALNAWIAGYARARRHVFLDYHAAMVDARGLLQPTLNDDGLHPNAAGYAVMAPLAEKAIAQALRR
jgi:lysophospholipase L1-like esterase